MARVRDAACDQRCGERVHLRLHWFVRSHHQNCRCCRCFSPVCVRHVFVRARACALAGQCLLVSLVLQKPANLAPAREVDLVLISMVAAMCLMDAGVALRGAKTALFRNDVHAPSGKSKDE